MEWTTGGSYDSGSTANSHTWRWICQSTQSRPAGSGSSPPRRRPGHYLVGGYSQDVSPVPGRVADLPRPAVVASEVKDRETLITFVEEAARTYREAVMSEGCSGLTGVRNAFRVEGGDWKSGSIYLWVVSGGGVTLFHGSEPWREGKPTDNAWAIIGQVFDEDEAAEPRTWATSSPPP